MGGGIEDYREEMRQKAQSPSHYTFGKIETIDYIKDKLGDGFIYYCLGNCHKYLSRAGKKDDIYLDLLKLKTYAEFAIKYIEENRGTS